MEKPLVMHFATESITLLRKYLLVMESWVSKCGSHSYRIEAPCYIRNVRGIANTGKAYVVGVAKRAVHNFVLEDTA
uniref:Truncated ribosomal protein L16 n=1 Tax=Nageia formosensis TaxID=675582 RepID=D2DX32_9CONI|nr:truncated ribosomal protein L16 [Nageia formosensis]